MMERIEPEIKSSDDTISTPAIATSTAVTVTDTPASTSPKDMSIEDLIKEIRRELEGIKQIVSELEH